MLVASLHRLNTVAVCLTSCWFDTMLHIQHITQREVSARLWNARTHVYKYYTSGHIQPAWRLVVFSALSSSLGKAFSQMRKPTGEEAQAVSLSLQRCQISRWTDIALHIQFVNQRKLHDLEQGSPNFFVQGPHKLLHNSSRAGHLA